MAGAAGELLRAVRQRVLQLAGHGGRRRGRAGRVPQEPHPRLARLHGGAVDICNIYINIYIYVYILHVY